MQKTSYLNDFSTSHILSKGINEIRERQLQIKHEQDLLLEKNKESYEDFVDVSGERLSQVVRSNVWQDNMYIKSFSDNIYRYKDKSLIPASVKTNKMNYIFDGTISLFGDNESEICKIASGKVPCSLFNEVYNIPDFGGEFWGSPAVSFLSNAILSTYFTLTESTINDIPLDSAISHVAPLPVDFTLSSRCRYAYRSKKGLHGFGFIHSGYSFGGHNGEESLYPLGKKFGPEDCDSWVAKITSSIYKFSNLDLFANYRLLTGSGSVFNNWLPLTAIGYIGCRYKPVSAAEIQPGDIHLTRFFDIRNNIYKTAGFGGNTAIVVEKIDENTVSTLGYNRGPRGMGTFDLQSFPVRDIMDDNTAKITVFMRVCEEGAPIGADIEKSDVNCHI
ncbi:MAG: hypothetical protein HON55_00095 [Legionellales bacterium]|jgi:hypothetical protein|nr:hypothetical protein [Legionellales bacterium]